MGALGQQQVALAAPPNSIRTAPRRVSASSGGDEPGQVVGRHRARAARTTGCSQSGINRPTPRYFCGRGRRRPPRSSIAPASTWTILPSASTKYGRTAGRGDVGQRRRRRSRSPPGSATERVGRPCSARRAARAVPGCVVEEVDPEHLHLPPWLVERTPPGPASPCGTARTRPAQKFTIIGPRSPARSTGRPPPRQGSVTSGSPPSTPAAVPCGQSGMSLVLLAARPGPGCRR